MLARVAGYPRPTVSWNLNGDPIKVSETISVAHYEDGTVSLSLMVTDDSSSGEYSCEAQNRNGIATTATNLVLNTPSMMIFSFLFFMIFEMLKYYFINIIKLIITAYINRKLLLFFIKKIYLFNIDSHYIIPYSYILYIHLSFSCNHGVV